MSYPRRKLGELLKVVGGYAFKSADFADDGCPVVRISNIQDGLVLLENIARIPVAKLAKGERFPVNPSDVLIAMSGATTGKIGVVPNDFEQPAYLNQRVGNFIIKGKQLDKLYLRHFLDSQEFQRQIQNSMWGVAQPNISGKQLENFTIPLPPLAEQQRISAVLDHADALRTKRRAALTKLDTLLQSTFLHLFGDPLINPNGWETLKFDKILDDLLYGTSSPPDYSDTGIPFIRATNIKMGTIVENDLRFISRNAAKKIEKCKLKSGDLVIVRSGVNSGDCAIIPDKYQDAYAGYDIIMKLPFDWAVFANHFINSPQGQHIIKPLTRRAGQPHLNATQIKNLEIINPPPNLRQRFVNCWKAIEEAKTLQTEVSLKLDNLFHSLQQRAFKGEL